MKKKILKILDIPILILFVLIISPYLFLSGGIERIFRYIRYVIDVGHKQEPKSYYF